MYVNMRGGIQPRNHKSQPTMSTSPEQTREQAILRLMEGATLEELASQRLASITTLRKWFKEDIVNGWLTCRRLGELLLEGVFHSTSLQGLAGIIDANAILPSGTVPTLRTPQTNPCVAAALNSVSLFDAARKGKYMACKRNVGFATVIAHHKPAVLLKLNRDKLPSPLHALTDECEFREPYRHRVPDIEVFHAGPIPWEAVEQAWTWGMQPGGQEHLTNWTSALTRPAKLPGLIRGGLIGVNLNGRDPAGLLLPRF